ASQSFSQLAFSEAADRYLKDWKIKPSKRTGKAPAASSIAKETQLLVKPKEFFGAERLNTITAERGNDFCSWRADPEPRGPAGAAIIAMEGGVLRRILIRAKLWYAIGDDVSFPKPPKTIGRALTATEKSRLLNAAGANPNWQTAYYAAVLALHTTMRGGEI